MLSSSAVASRGEGVLQVFRQSKRTRLKELLLPVIRHHLSAGAESCQSFAFETLLHREITKNVVKERHKQLFLVGKFQVSIAQRRAGCRLGAQGSLDAGGGGGDFLPPPPPPPPRPPVYYLVIHHIAGQLPTSPLSIFSTSSHLNRHRMTWRWWPRPCAWLATSGRLQCWWARPAPPGAASTNSS